MNGVGWRCDPTMLFDRTQGPIMDKVNGSKTRSGARLMDYDECKDIGYYHGHNRHGS